MDSCQIIYLLSSIAYLTLYYSGGSWLHPDDSFAWSRFIFLTAMLMLMEKYEMVPPPLSCLPLYMLYKVVAAVIIANIALITVWWQTEDFLKWFVSTAIKLIRFIPVVGPKVEEADETFWASVLQIFISSHFLLCVFISTGIIFGNQRSNSSASSCPPPRYLPPRRRWTLPELKPDSLFMSRNHVKPHFRHI
ncbi:hypothetical protein J6590_096247 [Homalodisca vitripennis]|nr:hypothetical protein J6590_096247 [Homalodisca vitripennis]